MLQLIELKEIRLDAYESSRIYKERVKRWHDKFINHREFWEGDLVLLFNSHLKLFPRELRSKWSSPFKVLKVYSYGAVEINIYATGSFKVNSARLEHYIADETLQGNVTCALPDISSS